VPLRPACVPGRHDPLRRHRCRAREHTLLKDLVGELKVLAAAPISSVETTLLIHPRVLRDFLDYNEFLGRGEQLIEDLNLRGILQIASFHPDYQFAGTEPGAVENYTNRPPFPMLHLLREESISAVASDPDERLRIPRRKTGLANPTRKRGPNCFGLMDPAVSKFVGPEGS
jgi:hypothetical protein